MGRLDVKEVVVPPFQITLERKKTLLAEFFTVVQNTLELRGAFAAGERHLDTSEWKLVKTVDDVRAYRSRRALHGGTETTASRADTLRSSSNLNSYQSGAVNLLPPATSSSEHQCRKSKKTRPPAIVISGLIDGTAEDAALGLLADTEINAKMRESYLGTELEDARLLTVLMCPTPQHPLSFIGLKWGLQSYGRFSPARDFVYLEGSGLTKDSEGLIVTYAVRQSVDVSDFLTLPTLPNTIRGHMSGCQTFGNTIPSGKTSHRVAEMFSRAYIEMDADFCDNVAAAAYAEKLMALAITMECANGHKLAYLMKQANQLVRPAIESVTGRITSNNHCFNCTRSLHKFSTHVLQRGGTCQICRRTFCSKCSLHKKICVSLGSAILKNLMLFCLSCMLEAKAVPARDVAIDKLRR